jgi:hypothetical protein
MGFVLAMVRPIPMALGHPALALPLKGRESYEELYQCTLIQRFQIFRSRHFFHLRDAFYCVIKSQKIALLLLQ